MSNSQSDQIKQSQRQRWVSVASDGKNGGGFLKMELKL